MTTKIIGTMTTAALPQQLSLLESSADDEITTNASTSNAPKTTSLEPKSKTKRSISFNPKVKCRFTLHLNRYTDEEIEKCWYTENEYIAIRHHVHETVQMMELKLDIDETCSQYCTRGLEHRTRKAREARFLRREDALITVLDLQDIHFLDDSQDFGFDPTEEIAKAYGEKAKTGVLAAYVAGISDQGAIKNNIDVETNDDDITDNMTLPPSSSYWSKKSSSPDSKKTIGMNLRSRMAMMAQSRSSSSQRGLMLFPSAA